MCGCALFGLVAEPHGIYAPVHGLSADTEAPGGLGDVHELHGGAV